MAVFVLMTLVVSGQSPASETKSSRLGALAARQDLHDLICYARADGKITQTERSIILAEAKDILSHDEYATFKKAFDRIAPPKKPSQTQLAKAARKKATSVTMKRLPKPADNEPELVIPTGVSLPDRIAPPPFSR